MMNHSELVDQLEAANTVPQDCMWWGADYEAFSDVLMLHALTRGVPRVQKAQLFVYQPLYMCRPALQDTLRFSLADDALLAKFPGTRTGGRYFIELKSTSDDKTNSFVVTCDAVTFAMPCHYAHDSFHLKRELLFLNASDRGKVKERAHMLQGFDGATLRWQSISSRLSSEFVLRADQPNRTSFISFYRPFFVDIAKIMHNVHLRPASEKDIFAIYNRLGERYTVITTYYHATESNFLESNSLNGRISENIVIIECDEGWFYMLTEGVGFHWNASLE